MRPRFFKFREFELPTLFALGFAVVFFGDLGAMAFASFVIIAVVGMRAGDIDAGA